MKWSFKIIFVFLLLFISACSSIKEEDECVDNIGRRLSLDEKSIIPYLQDDTVKMMDNKGDSSFYLICWYNIDKRYRYTDIRDKYNRDCYVDLEYDFLSAALSVIHQNDSILNVYLTMNTKSIGDGQGAVFELQLNNTKTFSMNSYSNKQPIYFYHSENTIPNLNEYVINDILYEVVYYRTAEDSMVDSIFFTRNYGLIKISFANDSLDLGLVRKL